ncbi:hypothetical protein QTG54_004369 [Skeletonema marinoi]|uniref:Uncharacterized protein n=1 Tax=Skeletonema marinoi TaxID=267567 RepID=A0AAD9DGS9_9STRA|nr:hypothetical protein QTG54_004369 [Skeletonema marinoi]
MRRLVSCDMKAVMSTAHLIRVHEMLDEEVDGESPENLIHQRHIIEAFKRTRPSLLPEDRQKLQRYYQPFRADVISNSGSGQDRDAPASNRNNLKTSFR